MKKFLTAEWRDLIMANYEVEPAVLADRLPPGTEIDLYQGKCFVSLVGFMFLNTRVMGVPVPFHINFPEVNLRFYVNRRTADGEVRRGVVFIKEIVSRRAIAAVARIIYGEPYECWKMTETRTPDRVEYCWRSRDSAHSMAVDRTAILSLPEAGSKAQFITEHYWGYTKRDGGRVDEFKVEHPSWQIFETDNCRIDVDFREVYGEDFAHLNEATPYSVLLAQGSPVTVFKGTRIDHR